MPVVNWSSLALGSVTLADGGNIEADSNGDLWFPTSQGLAKFDIILETISYVTNVDGLRDDAPIRIAIDSSDGIWIGYDDGFVGAATVVVQKYDTGLASFTDYTNQDLFGVKGSYAGAVSLKINPFDGKVYVGEKRQAGDAILSVFDGAWTMHGASTLGLDTASFMNLLAFESADRVWVGAHNITVTVGLILYDFNTTSTIYNFIPNTDFGAALEDMLLISSTRLIVDINAGNIWRIDSGTESDTGLSFSQFADVDYSIFIDTDNIIWGPFGAGFGNSVFAYDDALGTVTEYDYLTVGGQGSSSSGVDGGGVARFLRGPDLTAIISKAEVVLPPPVSVYPLVRFSNVDVSIFITATSPTQINMNTPNLPVGDYMVTVVTEEGVSNAVPFSIVEDINPFEGFTKVENHVARANSRMLQQYKRPHLDSAQYAESTQLSKMIEAVYTQGLQELEDASFTIIPKLDIDSNVGAALDGIGVIVGQPRNGQNDDTYKIYLKGKTALNNSNGTSDDIYRIWNAFSLANNSEINEVFPAGIEIVTDTSPAAEYVPVIKKYVDDALGVGISLTGIIVYNPVDAFRFSTSLLPPLDPLHGFGDEGNPLTGGKLATIL